MYQKFQNQKLSLSANRSSTMKSGNPQNGYSPISLISRFTLVSRFGKVNRMEIQKIPMSTRIASTYIQRDMVTKSWTSITSLFCKKNTDKMTGSSIFSQFLLSAGRRQVSVKLEYWGEREEMEFNWCGSTRCAVRNNEIAISIFESDIFPMLDNPRCGNSVHCVKK